MNHKAIWSFPGPEYISPSKCSKLEWNSKPGFDLPNGEGWYSTSFDILNYFIDGFLDVVVGKSN